MKKKIVDHEENRRTILQLKSQGLGTTEIAKKMKVKRAYVNNHIAYMKNKNKNKNKIAATKKEYVPSKRLLKSIDVSNKRLKVFLDSYNKCLAMFLVELKGRK
jgi:DNA-binding CsgD family transcriptional regulator